MPSLPETRASLILRLPDAADARAWDEMLAVYGPLVYRLARRHGLQPADSDDVVQEVLAAVARSVESWLARPERGPFRAWLLRIARNLAINALVRPKHRPLATGDSHMAQRLMQHPDSNGDVASQVDLECRRELFRWAAERVRDEVAERTWQAFWLSTVEEQSIGATAEQLKMSVGSVYIARSRVMARLREFVRHFEEHSS
jgi:RNA polymerase sigma-70 factor (ECF subfamily)